MCTVYKVIFNNESFFMFTTSGSALIRNNSNYKPLFSFDNENEKIIFLVSNVILYINVAFYHKKGLLKNQIMHVS